MNPSSGPDPVWEERYRAGHSQRYPWDCVVSFVFRHAPRDRPRSQVAILEVGCGTGSNLWFAAREGFRVAGIDASPSAIETARKRFEAEGLEADLRVGSFADLPFPDASFDLAVDRGALVCAGRSVALRAVEELHRVLKPGGMLLFNPFSTAHGGRLAGQPCGDGQVTNISVGPLKDCGRICFYSRQEVFDTLGPNFAVVSCSHLLMTEDGGTQQEDHAEWRVVAQKR